MTLNLRAMIQHVQSTLCDLGLEKKVFLKRFCKDYLKIEGRAGLGLPQTALI